MFDYTICRNADNEVFLKACAQLEHRFPHHIKSNPAVDVDGSIIQKYTIKENSAAIFNDFEVDAVYIQSDFDLSEIFRY